MAAEPDICFADFFRTAVGLEPFDFQGRFAHDLPPLVNIPTGLGKTAMAVVGWLWRRFGAGDEVRRKTPRRLVYCLPMRVLVEQTRDSATTWVKRLREHGRVQRDVLIHVLMGGENEEDWDLHPECETIIIGTQDMLLSRALNRGYAASRSRWPLQFGLLHTDCLWVFDEIQLMGAGLATTAQLEAFRRLLPNKDAEHAKGGHGCRSVWMSATMQADWLKTVDFKDPVDALPRLELDGVDYKNEVTKRRNAKKPLKKSGATVGDVVALADEVRQAHKPGTRTIVVVNTVRRACALFDALKKHADAGKASGKSRTKAAPPRPTAAPSDHQPKFVLLHSRFRPGDRAKAVEAALADPPHEGTIIVSTQVIEAGVDVSATTLFTELAPWASLVQRFGRCNRRGEQNKHASVRWIDLPDEETFKRLHPDKVKGKEGKPKTPKEIRDAYDEQVRSLSRPYEVDHLRTSAERLRTLTDVGLGSLPKVKLPFTHTHVIRRKDLIDLFDTTPDLAGNDIDIDRFVREVEDSDVRAFWRAWQRPKGHEPPPKDEPAPRREELCPAPIGEFRDFVGKRSSHVWRWNFLDETWVKVDVAKIMPGQVFLVHADAGGYSPENGWDAKSTGRVEPVPPRPADPNAAPDATDEDAPSQIGAWQTIAEHTNEVCGELGAIVAALPLDRPQLAALRTAARWHDWGKVHMVFQNAVDDGQAVQRRRGTVTRRARPDGWIGNRVVAKAPGKRWSNGQFVDAGWWRRYDWPDGGRKHFRHELASALVVLQRPHDSLKSLTDDELNLVAYLVAAHHGKVRLSIRSLPNEIRPRDAEGNPAPQKRFARGVWDGDTLPSVDLGDDVTAPEVTLSLEPMELGLSERPPFAGQPSWAERMIRLRDTLGPFRLAYLEAILRAADMRASKAAERRASGNQHAGTCADTKEADHG